jgi:hypothetical protein
MLLIVPDGNCKYLHGQRVRCRLLLELLLVSRRLSFIRRVIKGVQDEIQSVCDCSTHGISKLGRDVESVGVVNLWGPVLERTCCGFGREGVGGTQRVVRTANRGSPGLCISTVAASSRLLGEIEGDVVSSVVCGMEATRTKHAALIQGAVSV